MPVFGIRWNAYSLPGLQLLWHFIFKLIVTTASNGNENLRSVMMDMPVIAAARRWVLQVETGWDC